MDFMVQGILQTQRVMTTVRVQLWTLLVSSLDNFSRKVSTVAKDQLRPGRGVETAALKTSIHHRLEKMDMRAGIANFSVKAGKLGIARGEGEFVYARHGKRKGQRVSYSPTITYAGIVEEDQNRKYMKYAFDWANKNLLKYANRAIGASLRARK